MIENSYDDDFEYAHWSCTEMNLDRNVKVRKKVTLIILPRKRWHQTQQLYKDSS